MDILLTSIVAGASGAMVKQLAEKGVEWIVSLVTAHSPAVQEKIKSNAQNFLERLAKRVEILESELPIQNRTVFDEALCHPGTSLLMQKALISASTTDNDDRHEVLSELIAQRLSAGEDDLLALAGGAACDIVSAINSNHIRLLGIMSTLFDIRPIAVPEITTKEKHNELFVSWWHSQMSSLCIDTLKQLQFIDLRHLEGLGCLRISSVGQFDIKNTLIINLALRKYELPIVELEKLSWWPNLIYLWEMGLKKTTLTSIGLMIGTLFHDSIIGRKTIISWNRNEKSI